MVRMIAPVPARGLGWSHYAPAATAQQLLRWERWSDGALTSSDLPPEYQWAAQRAAASLAHRRRRPPPLLPAAYRLPQRPHPRLAAPHERSMDVCGIKTVHQGPLSKMQHGQVGSLERDGMLLAAGVQVIGKKGWQAGVQVVHSRRSNRG